MNSNSIEIQSISKSYQTSVKALDQISFTVNPGELFGLIGPDGAGKTSLIRILTTLIIADKGQAKVAGYDVVKDYKNIRQIVGYMPGKFSLYEDLSVEENLNFFASVFGTTVKENYDLIKPIYRKIEPFKKRKAGALSGGMKQKLALSCSLIHKPKVLFLDEPTTGVDAVSRKEFWEMLKELQAAGLTILVSTPYMDEAEMCQRVALMQDGKILNLDTPENIRKSFKHQLFALKSDNIYHLLTDLRNLPTARTVNAFGQYIHYTDTESDQTTENLKRLLSKSGHHNLKVKITKPLIEDCFMESSNK
ncbi:MAG: ABC transporter ATP-binding protein [Bacteroidota bacterium]|nr:ABC transporter ATP-binding protein [Bacteroidota bacterium]